MKKVLIITYYWPPAGGAGVQRWLKFTKYLPEFGIEPIILTVDPNYATYPQIDESLLNDVNPQLLVYHTRCFEFYSLYRLISKKKEVIYGGFANENKRSFTQKIAKFIRGNIFLPDPRKGWNRYAFKKASELIRQYKIDTIITTSPPHSTQLIGLTLKKKFQIKWISDLRDPWTDIYYYNQFNHTQLALSIDLQYEKQVIKWADDIITVSEDLKRIFSSKSDRNIESKIHVIPNGFDEEDFKVKNIFEEAKKVITYTGTISDTYDIDGFIKALELLDEKLKVKLKIRFVGATSESIIPKIEATGIEVEQVKYVPHAQAIDYMLQSSILLLVIPKVDNNKGIITGKFFEYLATGKPVLAIGPPNGDLAKLISETQCGELFDYSESLEMKNFIIQCIDGPFPLGDAKASYSRKVLSQKLAEILNA
jgi:glycosyltransferase involved in cell wall biosynthesis